MKNSLSRLIEFSRKTGDRLIVTDSDGRDPVVILGFDDYERLVDCGQAVGVVGVGDDSGLGVSDVDEFDDLALDVGVGDSASVSESKSVVSDNVSADGVISAMGNGVVGDGGVSGGADAVGSSLGFGKNDRGKVIPDEEEFYLEPSE